MYSLERLTSSRLSLLFFCSFYSAGAAWNFCPREFYYSTIPGAMLAAARAVVLTSVIRTLVKTMVKTVVQQPPGKTMVFVQGGLLVRSSTVHRFAEGCR